MTLKSEDIGMFLTGGSSNTDPNLSLGGNVSTTEVISDITHRVFRRITDTEASSGITLYRCVAIKNKSVTDQMVSVVFYMVQDTTSPSDLASYSFAAAGKNGTETPIPNETTLPPGDGINFINTLTRSGGLNLGNFAPGDFRCIWLRIIVNPGAEVLPDNAFKVRVEVNPTSSSGSGGSGSGGGSTPPPDPNTGVNFTIAATGDMGTGSTAKGIVDKMKNRNTGLIIFNGDLSYSSSMGGWLDMTSSVRKNSIVSFGNHDVNDGDGGKGTISDLENAYSISHTYYSKIFKSVGIVVMEAGENESVSHSSGSSQYNFVKGELQKFSQNASLEWIFVCNHYPVEGPPGAHHPNEDNVRDIYVPLFEQYGVDCVITAHNHALWHSKLLKYNSSSPDNPTSTGTDPNYSYSRSTDNHGKMYFDVGAGGKSHYDLGSIPSYVPFANNKDYGYLFMEFSNDGKVLTFKFYDSSDKLLKKGTITHT